MSAASKKATPPQEDDIEAELNRLDSQIKELTKSVEAKDKNISVLQARVDDKTKQYDSKFQAKLEKSEQQYKRLLNRFEEMKQLLFEKEKKLRIYRKRIDRDKQIYTITQSQLEAAQSKVQMLESLKATGAPGAIPAGASSAADSGVENANQPVDKITLKMGPYEDEPESDMDREFDEEEMDEDEDENESLEEDEDDEEMEDEAAAEKFPDSLKDESTPIEADKTTEEAGKTASSDEGKKSPEDKTVTQPTDIRTDPAKKEQTT